MLRPNLIDRHLNLRHVVLSLLDGSPPVPLAPPPLDVLRHLVVPPLLLLDLVAQLAVAGLVVGIVDQLEATRLARSVLLVALLAEIAPFPVPASPACLFEIAHLSIVFLFWRGELTMGELYIWGGGRAQESFGLVQYTHTHTHKVLVPG